MSKADLIAKLLDMRDSADEQDQREIDQLLADPSKRNDEAALQGLIEAPRVSRRLQHWRMEP
jgi:hypothetical protein